MLRRVQERDGPNDTGIHTIPSSHAPRLILVIQNLTGEDAPLKARHDEVLAAATEAYGNLTNGLFPRSANRFSEVLANWIGTEFRITLAANAVEKEKKTREREINKIKMASIVSVELEHRTIDVGEPYKVQYPIYFNFFVLFFIYLF